MIGAVKKKRIGIEQSFFQSNSKIVCPLCERFIPPLQLDAHHLVPKSKGGKETQYLHRICHRQIHAILTESELANQFNKIEDLKSHPEINKFILWVKNKPNEFYEKVKKSSRIR